MSRPTTLALDPAPDRSALSGPICSRVRNTAAGKATEGIERVAVVI